MTDEQIASTIDVIRRELHKARAYEMRADRPVVWSEGDDGHEKVADGDTGTIVIDLQYD